MPTLYDAEGKPIDKTRLAEEVAAPTVTGVRQVLSGHPAQNLTPRRLTSLLLAAEQGDAMAYLGLAEEMEEKDLHYRSVLSTRKLQVAGLPVTVESASDSAEDVKAVLGQTVTTDVVQARGTVNVHERVHDDIEAADAAQLSAKLKCDLVWPLVDLNLGPRKRYHPESGA